MSFICGTDIGGTFTDCVIASSEGGLLSVKAPSTPKDFSKGLFDAIEFGANRLGLGIEEFLGDTDFLFHGTTVATNALVTRRGAKVGLITTKGFRDIMHIMRGKGRTTGVSISDLLHVPTSNKPDPLVPKELIEEVSERIDCNGKVVVPVNEAEAIRAIERLLEKGVEAVAIGFLWSFKNPLHEQFIGNLIKEKAPGLFVTLSSEIAPRWGEYERMTSAVINSYIGPMVARYLQAIERKARELKYEHPLLIMQANGGVSNTARVSRLPAFTFESGPVAGVAASVHAGGLMGFRNIIASDMGGTTFDVGLIYNGNPAKSSISTTGKYEFFIPSVNVSSIGSGGGSIIWIDQNSGVLKVGPLSAGAEPGPLCYDQGGTEPTVTDADLYLGYINPDYFLGGRIKLNKAKAEEAFARLGKNLGMDPIQVAHGAIRIVDYQMAELIRQVTIERGHDPREFVVFAYGGAGPTHAGSYARELGIKHVVIPRLNISSAWSAFGTAISDVVHSYEVNEIQAEPFSLDVINRHLRSLKEAGLAGLAAEGIKEKDISLTLSVDMRYKAQVHVIEVPIQNLPLEPADLETLKEEFEKRYQGLYGKGTGYASAGFEMFCLRCHAAGRIKKIEIKREPLSGKLPPGDAFKADRSVYWPASGGFQLTKVYDGMKFMAGNEIGGPAIVELPDTTVLVHPDQVAKVDRYRNLIIVLP